MPLYTYSCPEHGPEVIHQSMSNVARTIPCPTCGRDSDRDLVADIRKVPVHYNSQGFHSTDYDKHGDKLERLNSTWSKAFGEEPPEPAHDVPIKGDKY